MFAAILVGCRAQAVCRIRFYKVLIFDMIHLYDAGGILKCVLAQT